MNNNFEAAANMVRNQTKRYKNKSGTNAEMVSMMSDLELVEYIKNNNLNIGLPWCIAMWWPCGDKKPQPGQCENCLRRWGQENKIDPKNENERIKQMRTEAIIYRLEEEPNERNKR